MVVLFIVVVWIVIQTILYFSSNQLFTTYLSFEFQNEREIDISSSQARKGKDIQGIPWGTLNITRESYRRTRLEQYKNYENVQHSGEASEKA